jgi:signal transduction histidine kinase
LIAALGQLAEKMRDTHNTEVSLKGQANVEELLDANAQGVLFYIVEEAVNNARKHAKATNIWVRLYRREAFVMVEIEDDGVGFDVSAVDASYDQRGSLGMVNMRERAELIEGTLRIQSAAGRGTKISILVPIHRAGAQIAGASEGGPALPIEMQSQRSAASDQAAPRATQPKPPPGLS